MLAVAIVAAVTLHAAPPPAVQLAAAQRAAAFRVLVLPQSMQLLQAEASHDGSEVRIEYSIEGAVIAVDERVNTGAGSPLPQTSGELFNLDGYPAVYRELNGYRQLSALVWYRPDITVTVSSLDRVNAPLLIDVALGLR
jgi:hypothetical protein